MRLHLARLAIKQNLKIGLMAGITIKTRWTLVNWLATFKEHKMKYEFDTTVGEGSVIVTVVMAYETDEEGTYNENIDEVWFEGRNVMGIFTDAQFKELEMEGTMRLTSHLLEESDHAKIIAYECD
jgi:hypothetical protein